MRQCENLKWTAKLKLGILLSTPPAHRMRISQFGESLPPHAFFGWVCHPHPSNTLKTMLRTFKTMQKNWRKRCLHQLRSSAISCTGTVHSTKCEIVILLNLTTRYTYNETNRKLTTGRSLLPPFLYVVHKVRLAMACRSTNLCKDLFSSFPDSWGWRQSDREHRGLWVIPGTEYSCGGYGLRGSTFDESCSV